MAKDKPGEVNGRPQLTRDGFTQLQERVDDIRERRLPEMRPLLVETERDERIVAEFERLMEEASALDTLLAQADVISITADATEDLAIPEAPYSFGVLETAQALGDFQSLDRTGRRGLLVRLSKRDVDQFEAVAKQLVEAL